jgi:hypothetical protein
MGERVLYWRFRVSTPSPKPLEPRLAVMIVVAALFVAGCLSDFGPPTATFNGTRCSYSGLEEFSFDDGLVTFTFDNKSSGQAGIAIWKIPATTPTDDFNDIAANGPSAYLDPDSDLHIADEAPAGESVSVQVLVSPGWWLINCFDEDGDHPADMVLVAND